MKNKKIIIAILVVIGLCFTFFVYHFAAAPKTEATTDKSAQLDKQKVSQDISADKKDETLLLQDTGSIKTGEVPKCCDEE